MRRVVRLTGTARPRPTPATAVLMPTTREWLSASAPPELPGFRAASVWITSSISRPALALRVGRDRPRALTTPAVTEPARPSGLPTATTSWPTTSSSASPSSAGGGVVPDARSTARSDSGSAPTTPERGRGAVRERGGAGRGAAHHVRVGEQEAVPGEDDARAEALPAPAAPAAAGIAPAGLGHPQAGHLAGELGRDPGDDLRVAVQWLVLWHAASYPGGSGECGPCGGLHNYNLCRLLTPTRGRGFPPLYAMGGIGRDGAG